MQNVKVSNLQNNEGREVVNQFIIDTAKAQYFQSYNTIIAKRANGTITLDKDFYNYSCTTSKYLAIYLGLSNAKELREAIKAKRYKMARLNPKYHNA